MNIWNTLVLLGAIQGIILSLTLVFDKDKLRGQYYLAFMMLILAINSLVTFLWTAQLLHNHTNFNNDFLFTHLFALGPCFYLYIRKSIDKNKSNKPDWVYFLPVFIDILLRSALYISQYYVTDTRFQALSTQHLVLTKYGAVLLFWIYYTATALYYLKNKNTYTVDNEDDFIKTSVHKWLRALIIGVFIFLLPWSATVLTADGLHQDQNFFYYYPSEILLVIFIYWVGFAGAHRIKIVYRDNQKTQLQFFNSIPTHEVQSTLTRIKEAMEKEKLYLNPDLNLVLFSQHIGVQTKIISSVLNQEVGKGFNEYINFHRIEVVKHNLIHNPKNLTISEIAFAAGFNSLPTFQRVFKAQTNMSPKDFIAKNNSQKQI